MYANLRVEVAPDQVLYATHVTLDQDGVLFVYLDVDEENGYDEYEHGPQEVREVVATADHPVKVNADF